MSLGRKFASAGKHEKTVTNMAEAISRHFRIGMVAQIASYTGVLTGADFVSFGGIDWSKPLLVLLYFAVHDVFVQFHNHLAHWSHCT